MEGKAPGRALHALPRADAAPDAGGLSLNNEPAGSPLMFSRLTYVTATATPLVAAICLAAFAPASQGANLPIPSVEYSADRVMETEAGTFEGKVYAAKDKERTETSMRGMTSVMILRRDKQLGWMLMPAQKMYQQMDFAKA